MESFYYTSAWVNQSRQFLPRITYPYPYPHTDRLRPISDGSDVVIKAARLRKLLLQKLVITHFTICISYHIISYHILLSSHHITKQPSWWYVFLNLFHSFNRYLTFYLSIYLSIYLSTYPTLPRDEINWTKMTRRTLQLQCVTQRCLRWDLKFLNENLPILPPQPINWQTTTRATAIPFPFSPPKILPNKLLWSNRCSY